MTISEFILEINREFNIDVKYNVEIKKDSIILHNDHNFNFFKLFVLELLKSGLQKGDNFKAIGISEDNNLYIKERYYKYFDNYYAIYNEKTNNIVLKKNT